MTAEVIEFPRVVRVTYLGSAWAVLYGRGCARGC
jgi:hypothetical protein